MFRLVNLSPCPHVLNPVTVSFESEKVTLARIEAHTTIEVQRAKSSAMGWKHIGIALAVIGVAVVFVGVPVWQHRAEMREIEAKKGWLSHETGMD